MKKVFNIYLLTYTLVQKGFYDQLYKETFPYSATLNYFFNNIILIPLCFT